MQPTLDKSELKAGLKQRHMTMIALGGVIGAGLFVGSGVVIQQTGPAAVLSFLITGGLIVLVMRMLGEMACAMPAVGSFYEYARLAFAGKRGPGKLAGFLTGWMYWYFWVIVVAVEAVAGREACAVLATGCARVGDQSCVAGDADRDEPDFGRQPTANSSSGSRRSRSLRSSYFCSWAACTSLGLWPALAAHDGGAANAHFRMAA